MSGPIITIRQQFLIPTTPFIMLDGYLGLEPQGTNYASSTTTVGDSYYTDFSITGGPGIICFRFECNLGGLVLDTDYFVLDVDLTAIAGELVITSTYFKSSVPYPSWRFRLNLKTDPYTTILIAPLSPEGDITKVSFSASPYWITTVFGIEGRAREYMYIKLSGLVNQNIFPYDFLNIVPLSLPSLPRLV